MSLFSFFCEIKRKGEFENIDSSLFLEWITLFESRTNEHFSKRVNLLSFRILSLFSFFMKLKGKESLNIDSILQLHDSLFLEWITLFESRTNEHFSKRVNLLSFRILSLFSFFMKLKGKESLNIDSILQLHDSLFLLSTILCISVLSKI